MPSLRTRQGVAVYGTINPFTSFAVCCCSSPFPLPFFSFYFFCRFFTICHCRSPLPLSTHLKNKSVFHFFRHCEKIRSIFVAIQSLSLLFVFVVFLSLLLGVVVSRCLQPLPLMPSLRTRQGVAVYGIINPFTSFAVEKIRQRFCSIEETETAKQKKRHWIATKTLRIFTE